MMWVVPEVQVGSPRLSATSAPPVAHWAQEARARERRRWIVRTLLVLFVTFLALCLFVVWERDRMMVQGSLGIVDESVRLLQQRYDEFGYLPVAPPMAGDPEPLLSSMYYASSRERFYAHQVSGPVIIAFTPVRTSIPQVLGPSGRCVIIFEDGHLRSTWMSVSEFHGAWQRQQQHMIAFEQDRATQPPELP